MKKLKRPSKRTLEKLYLDQRLTTRQIGNKLGVSKHPVEDWLKYYGIPRRPTGRGLANRGIEPPTPDELYRLVHIEHESYEQIAARYGVDSSAIRHWLIRHNIRRPTLWDTRRKGHKPPEPGEATLRHLYLVEGISLRSIGQSYGVSDGLIADRCRQYGIPIKASGFNGGVRFECTDGHLVRSTYEQRVDEWLSTHAIPHIYEPVLPFDRRMKADFYANGVFIEVWGVTNSRRYKERADRKRGLYALHNLPLIEIPVHAFDSNRNRMWERRLRTCLTPPSTVHEPAAQLSLDNFSHTLGA